MGFSVADTSSVGDDFPDLVIGRMGLTGLIEVKSPRGLLSAEDRLSEGQVQFVREWQGSPVIVAYRAEDAAKKFLHWLRRMNRF